MQGTRVGPNHSQSSLSSLGPYSMPSTPCAVPLPNSAHISHPYQPSSTPPVSSKARLFRRPLTAASAPAPSSAPNMGQNQSTVASPSTSQRFKRVFSARRKQSDDESTYQGKELSRIQSSIPPSPSTVSSPPTPTVGKHFSVFGYRKPSLLSPAPPSIPPPLPTRPLAVRTEARPQPPGDEHARPLIINSSGISAAVQFVRQDEDGNKSEETFFAGTERRRFGVDPMKEDWRKSDSTMASHHTIRPGAGCPQRPRPVSTADSTHSGNTIVQMNKRVSILMTGTDLDIPQESHDSSDDVYVAVPRVQSPSSILNAQNRRSLSIKFGSALSFKTKTSPDIRIETTSDFQPVTPSRSREPLPVSYKAYTPAIDTTAANGFIAPQNSHSNLSLPTGNQIRSRLAAWTTGTPLSQNPETPPPPPPIYIGRSRGSPRPPPNFRQTAVSISGSIAPAAMDLGKRAMEKMGRAWGSRVTGTSSGYSSSPSESPFPKRRTPEPALGRHPNDSTPSQISSISISGKGKRRTPNAPSGSWSIGSSSTSISDDPYHGLSGINSSRCLRGPLSSGGLVFGQKLVDCVRDTAIEAVRLQLISGEYSGGEAETPFGIPQLEDRLLPAVVVRCVQHLLTWGIQEEGLFRMNGRSSHIKELRREFDQGVDYDISQCAPYDMDPHVVSSLFKLFLREIPEPLLTHELTPYFDAVMAAEDNLDSARSRDFQNNSDMSDPTLPSGPKSYQAEAMRKPPSLTTLAMPNLAGMRSASQSTVYAIATLVSRLPRENRDLLFTLTELMKTTANHSKQTKMPLANLLLVLCPSLNMKPSLLRLLCESDDIWRGPPNMVDNAIPIAPILGQDSVHSRANSFDSIGVSSRADASQLGNPIGSRRGVTRDPIETVHGNPSPGSSLNDATPLDMASDTISYEDDFSDVSFSDGLHSGSTDARVASPPLSSSVESLATPSTSSEGPSFMIPPIKGEPHMPPVIADQVPLPLNPSPRNTIISSPIPFHPSTENASPTPAPRRRSSPNIPVSVTSTPLKRLSRSSLPHLFSKKSATSLQSYSSVPSTPPCPMPADSQDVELPPVLTTPISLSPIDLQFEPGESRRPDLKVVPILSRLRSNSSATTDSPMSAFYATPTGSFISVSSEKTTEPHDKYIRNTSRLSVALTSDDPADDDWTRSVLQAVDIDSNQLVASQR